MEPVPTIDDVLRLADGLSAIDKLRVIERLAPQVESALLEKPDSTDQTQAALDEQYQRGYEQTPEDAADVEALLPHLPAEQWE
ncbi:MAG TPA: hypothetical protein VN541_12080 [Tepidisphaeraceae bacterium]|nr:hypothetical protein [Tepidisphaeraceae bacterium]